MSMDPELRRQFLSRLAAIADEVEAMASLIEEDDSDVSNEDVSDELLWQRMTNQERLRRMVQAAHPPPRS